VTARDHHQRARAEFGDARRLAGFGGGVLLLHAGRGPAPPALLDAPHPPDQQEDLP